MKRQLVLLLFIVFILPLKVQGQYGLSRKADKLRQLSEIHNISVSLPLSVDSLSVAQATLEFIQKYKFGEAPNLMVYNGLDSTQSLAASKAWVKDFMEKPFMKYLPIIQKPKDELERFHRWKKQFNTSRYVLINIANAELYAFQNDSLILQMKVIVGTQKNQTPIMATHADAIVVYPYWTPTRNIIFNEIIPKVIEDSNYLARNNFEVLDKRKNVIDPSSLDWKVFGRNNFPYTIRQSTGCDNSLGILKVNIRNPYSIYLHDTPHTAFSQGLFNRKERFFSHGCIRLEKPLELVEWLKPIKEIDKSFLEKCLLNQEPEVINLEENVPVFIMYFTKYQNYLGEDVEYKDFYSLGD